MTKMRNSILTLACFGLLSTTAMGMPAENMTDQGGDQATTTDPMSQSSPGMSSDSMGTDGQGSGMGSGHQNSESITGEILTVEGDLYTVKDSTGKEVQLHVDESTQKTGKLKEGDKIEAEVTAEGHALMLKKAKGMN
ncbi:MAG: hypothetical protein H0X47_07780 [Nitrospirales bacterium]|nr:hypothetical protein [Nitrospirales bacterium]